MSDENLSPEPMVVDSNNPGDAVQVNPHNRVVDFISDESWAAATSKWINSHVRSSPMAESAAGWNHLGLVLPKLREYLEAEMAKIGVQV